jgi:hypothetical protein
VSVDLITASLGTWSSTVSESNTTYFFNKASTAAYLSAGMFKAYLSVPFAWTIESSDSLMHTAWIGDISTYAGMTVGLFEPRIGIVAPTGYPLDKEWIGTGNVRLQAGLGMNPALRENRKAALSGEVMWHLFLPGQEGAHAGSGSWTVLPSVKASYGVLDQLRMGIEILGSYADMQWTWGRESKLGIVPNLFTEYRAGDRFSLTMKGGAGPSYAKENAAAGLSFNSYSINGSVSLNVYP